ncbi:MAG: tRNA uridine-5-carboxymethylaminomethyl(34) synthesis GTPase MnmE [Candidatus Omnitrophica bacterium]|nr:tRNA uridine-5-carboxymethylaminomethyl(34) synthesis GTPase MnmE [Candidatus Omnitrophota bacterium]
MHAQGLDDTIAAISTPLGQGGIGIVRISGKNALPIAGEIFVSSGASQVSGFKTHTVHFGRIVNHSKNDEEVIDEVLLTVMRAPRTYTCEDVVEISCHGGQMALRKILDLILQKEARLAEPGEFTKRAFLNGRIDLTQAEAVLDIIQAKTDSFLRASVKQLKGDLTVELDAIREILMDVYTELEAIVNFPEDDIGVSDEERLKEKIADAQKRVEKLLEFRHEGKILRDGARVVICGKPNVGKSSLLNVLLKQPRAIVSSVEGTTRDTIEELTQINEIPLQLIDTAGILTPRDEIEKEAVRRSHLNIEQADLILFMLDGSCPLDSKDKDIMKNLKGRSVIVVFNKCDCAFRIHPDELKDFFPHQEQVKISALLKQNIDELKDKIAKNILHGRLIEPGSILISNMRQIESLDKCLHAIARARQHFSEKLSLEFISEEIKIAVNHLDNVTGKNISQDLLDKIFSSFCIGK